LRTARASGHAAGDDGGGFLLEVIVVTEHDEVNVAEMFTEAYWDERYQTRDALWSGQPNTTLVAEVSGLSPGQALDAGCGEGADSIWLAGRGWQVTGVDISAVALDRAAAHAATAGSQIAGRIGWQRADLLDWDPGRDQYDLATAHYMHFPPGLRDEAFRRLAATTHRTSAPCPGRRFRSCSSPAMTSPRCSTRTAGT
jgi:SAM-dependent methyltransferase